MTQNPRRPLDLLDEAIAAFQQMNAPGRPNDAGVLVQLAGTDCVKPDVSASYPVRSNRRRPFLLPPLVACALVFAIASSLFTGNSTTAAIDLILQEATKHVLVRYQQRQTTEMKDLSGHTDSIVFADLQAPRVRQESNIKKEGKEVQLLEIDDASRHWMLNSEDKTAVITTGNNDYKSFLGALMAMRQKKGVKISLEKLNDRDAELLQLQEGNNTTLLWIDTSTKLPLRMEYIMIHPTPTIFLNRFVWYEFQWNPIFPLGIKEVDGLFEVRVPDGYTVHDQTKSSE